MYGIPSLNCIKNLSDFSLTGDFYSDYFSYTEIRLQTCLNTSTYSTCKSDEEITDYFKFNTVSIAVINSFFDFTDFR
jgi:hypothetical protein